jgi:hypothetical protein
MAINAMEESLVNCQFVENPIKFLKTLRINFKMRRYNKEFSLLYYRRMVYVNMNNTTSALFSPNLAEDSTQN